MKTKTRGIILLCLSIVWGILAIKYDIDYLFLSIFGLVGSVMSFRLSKKGK